MLKQGLHSVDDDDAVKHLQGDAVSGTGTLMTHQRSLQCTILLSTPLRTALEQVPALIQVCSRCSLKQRLCALF